MLFNPGIPGPRLPNTLLFILMSVPFAWRRRAPVAVLFVVLGASGIQAEVFVDPSAQPPFESFFALLAAFYSVAAYGEGRRSLLGAAAGGAVLLATSLYDLLAGKDPGNLVPPSVFWAAAWFIGRTLRQRRLQTERLQNLSAQLELEREEKAKVAVVEERSRIARELHDVVAHSISVMVIQAQAAQRLLEGEQRDARQALISIETNGRQALVELRHLLGILRRYGEEPALAPQPGLKHLDALIEQTRKASLPVELEIEGEAEPLPPGVDLTAYRIVQEALTNALKHAGPAHARGRSATGTAR
jgi:signal transduction histidine kinase